MSIGGPMDNFMFSVFPTLFFLIFALVLGIIIFNIIRGVSQWSYNNSQPVLTVDAKVVSKRTKVSRSMHNDSDGIGHHHHSYTRYYVTFEVESGDRMELHVKDNEYGMLVEGDTGKLTFQGTRYHGFQRKYENNL